MKEDSSIMENASGTPEKNEGSCAGGVGKGDRLFRRLKSTRDGRVKITVPAKVQNTSDKKYDPSAWYVCIVKRHKERDCRDFINTQVISTLRLRPMQPLSLKWKWIAKADQRIHLLLQKAKNKLSFMASCLSGLTCYIVWMY